MRRPAAALLLLASLLMLLSSCASTKVAKEWKPFMRRQTDDDSIG